MILNQLPKFLQRVRIRISQSSSYKRAAAGPQRVRMGWDRGPASGQLRIKRPRALSSPNHPNPNKSLERPGTPAAAWDKRELQAKSRMSQRETRPDPPRLITTELLPQ